MNNKDYRKKVIKLGAKDKKNPRILQPYLMDYIQHNTAFRRHF